MGYSIKLVGEDGEVVRVSKQYEGSDPALGGTNDADANITYNYTKHFHENLDNSMGIRWLYGKHAYDCVERLEAAVDKLGTERDADYWKPTPGNAGHALRVLLKWAYQHQKAIFMGD